MLGLLATGFILGVIFVNLIGLALIAAPSIGQYTLSRAVTPVAAALVLFFCEHFIGLGSLSWCWPFTTAAAVWMVACGLLMWRLPRHRDPEDDDTGAVV